ncbi:MAG: hypothetical protein AB7T38_14935 [Nitrospirales bacterium]
MAADPIIYCLEQVTDYDQFERLCHDLMAAEGYSSIEPLGGMKDKGRDAIYIDRHSHEDVTIFAYSVREAWLKKLTEDCEKIQKHGHKCFRIFFLCTADFSSTERDKAMAFVEASFGWKLDLFGLERLRILLGTVHPNVMANHPSIFCPPFFSQAGGLTIVSSPDYLIVDYADSDEVLAFWIARRLRLEGYLVWCRGLAPMGGSSLGETIEILVKNRAFRFLSIISPTSVIDPDLSSRRSMAHAIRRDLVLPIISGPIDSSRLDLKTRLLEAVSFTNSLAEGLGSLLDVLLSVQCPRSKTAVDITLRSFMPSEIICQQPEILYSNRFRVLKTPDVIKRFISKVPIDNDSLHSAGRKWAFRRVDPYSFLSFHSPPLELVEQHGIKSAGGVAWRHVPHVDNISTQNLTPELVRKTLQVAYEEKGLRFCNDRKQLFFPQGLARFERLYFTKPNGSKSFITCTGERKYWRPQLSAVYKYYLGPSLSTIRNADGSFGVLVRVHVRFTDVEGNILPTRTAQSRRKHLCKNWWNDDWFNRILAILQFLSKGDKIDLGLLPDETISISATPDCWTVPVSIDESALENIRASHEEVLSYMNEQEDYGDEVEDSIN